MCIVDVGTNVNSEKSVDVSGKTINSNVILDLDTSM